MTDYIIPLAIVLLLLPAAFGWFILIVSIRGLRRMDRRRREIDAKTDEWVRRYNAQCEAMAPPTRRKRELHAIAGGKPDDGTRAA